MAIFTISTTDVLLNLDLNPCEQNVSFVVKRMNQVFWRMEIMKNMMVFWEVVPILNMKLIKLMIAMKELIQNFVFVTQNCAILPTIFKKLVGSLLSWLQPFYTFHTIFKICCNNLVDTDYNLYNQPFSRRLGNLSPNFWVRLFNLIEKNWL